MIPYLSTQQNNLYVRNEQFRIPSSKKENESENAPSVEIQAKNSDSQAAIFLAFMYRDGLNGFQKDIHKAIHYFEIASKSNGPDKEEAALHLRTLYSELGHFYYFQKRDYLNAVKYLEKAAENGVSHAAQLLGEIYAGRKQSHLQKNFKKSLHFLELAVAQGSHFLALDLGYIFLNGISEKGEAFGVKDIDKAIKYFEITSKNDSFFYGERAYFELGRIYRDGKGGIPQDFVKARMNFEAIQAEKEIEFLKLFESAQKDSEEAFQLGKKFLDRTQTMVDYDLNQAVHYFEMAFAEDHSGAAFELGRIYRQKGVTKPENLLNAEKYLKYAAKAGYPGAATEIGQIYLVGEKGIKQDIKTAKALFEVDADLHQHPQAYVELGRMHRDGIGTAKDSVEAMRYFQMAINTNNPEAMTELGKMYREQGEDLLAKALFEKALNLSYYDAGTELGCLYRDGGNGIKQNFYAAENYFTQGANDSAKNRSYAAYQTALIAAEKTVSYDKQFRHYIALRFFEHAILLGNNEALIDVKRIGRKYLMGEGVKKDLELAEKYFKLEKLKF